MSVRKPVESPVDSAVMDLSVNSPALILSKNSGVFLAKIGSKAANIGLKLG